MSEPNNDYASVQINAAGSALDLAGTFVTCTDSTAPFQMSLNGGSWFRMERGIGIRVPTGFTKLFFRPIPGTAAGQTVSFYYGTIQVVDSRFNVVSDAPLISVYSRESTDFIIVPVTTGNLGIAATVDITGVFVDAAGANRPARSIVIQHFTAGKYLTVQYNDPVAGFTTINRVPANQPLEMFHGWNPPVIGSLIAAPLNFRINNLSGVAIDCDIYRTVWLN